MWTIWVRPFALTKINEASVISRSHSPHKDQKILTAELKASAPVFRSYSRPILKLPKSIVMRAPRPHIAPINSNFFESLRAGIVATGLRRPEKARIRRLEPHSEEDIAFLQDVPKTGA